jgi:tripartite-type tricarboxylate transporter receptor subunit TctC
MRRRIALAAAVLVAATAPAFGADWPSRPISMIVPFPAGGSADAVARLIARQLSERLGQQVIVDNKGGAAGNLGTDLVAKAAPDGYTIGISTSGPLANNKFLYKHMPFDPLTDLTAVAAVGEIPMGVAVNPGIKANTLKELLQDARNRPGKLSIGNPGIGTIGHLTAELIKSQSKVYALSVPYKGDAPATSDVVGGVLDAVVLPVTALLPQIQGGRLKGLAVTSRRRFAGLPSVPTAAEQGVPIEATVWFAVIGPRGLPAFVVARLNREVNAILATPEAAGRLAQFGGTPLGGSPQQLVQLMSNDTAKWKRVIESSHITLE